jgi:voltage-gated potassium channel
VNDGHYERVLFGLLLFAGVIACGTAGYMLFEGWSFIDALYMTVTAVTTVGFREVNDLDTGGRIYTIVVVLSGVGLAFYILTAMVAAIIEGDLRQLFGLRRMRMTIERLNQHFIVCGYGRVGAEIAGELLSRRTRVIVVDRDAEALERARSAGAFIVHGDATEEQTLIEAGARRAKALIAATDSDASNTFITLTARGLNDDLLVIARVSSPKAEAKLKQAGAQRVVSPYAIGGRRMALAALQPIMTDFIDFFSQEPTGGRLLAEFAVDEESGLSGREISQVLAGCQDVVALALREAGGGLRVGPPASTRLSLGDRLIVVGGETELQNLGKARP